MCVKKNYLLKSSCNLSKRVFRQSKRYAFSSAAKNELLQCIIYDKMHRRSAFTGIRAKLAGINMDVAFAEKLSELNNDFYRNQAVSFSDTRHAKWPGWERCLDEIRAASRDKQALRVLDIACGNLRFEEYLAKYCEELPVNWQVFVNALDACDDLVPETCAGKQVIRSTQKNSGEASGVSKAKKESETSGINKAKKEDKTEDALLSSGLSRSVKRITCDMAVTFTHCDIMQALASNTLKDALKVENFSEERAQVTVAFGFMHHVPLLEWCLQLLNDMISVTAPDGFVCVSFWRFMDDEAMAAKARKTHSQAIDYLVKNGYFDDCFEETRTENPWTSVQLEAGEFQGTSNDESRNATTFKLCKSDNEVRDVAAFESRKSDIFQQFNEGDYLLGWRNLPGVYRYCHSFSDEEIDSLVTLVADKAKCVARFRADGRTGSLNEYLVLQVC